MSVLRQIAGWVRGQSLDHPEKIQWFDRLAQWVNGYRFYVGSFTRDRATASGDQAVTGIPFRPSSIVLLHCFTTAAAAWSVGLDDKDTHACIYSNQQVTADTVIASTAASVFSQSTAGNNYTGLVSTLDANGFTMTWTRTGTPTSTMTIIYLAFK